MPINVDLIPILGKEEMPILITGSQACPKLEVEPYNSELG